jgi:nucleoside-diphosphate-sugar epimerase
MSRFLVTGGAGFIGSHIVEYLLKDKHFVKIIDNFSTGREENILNFKDKIEIIRADICDYEVIEEAFKGVDYVIHEAALRSVPKSFKDPASYNRVNIQGTLNVLFACVKNNVKRLVFASSSSIYGETEVFPEREETIPLLISPYALTKLTGEYYCKIFSKHFGLSTVSLRYFNVFGPRQSLEDEYAVVIPKFITNLLKDESPPIYGDGTQSRDFTYITNVVEATIKACEIKDFKGEVINIASGKDYSILELLDALNKIMNKSLKPKFLPPREGDVMKTLADISKARTLLGYQPKVDFIEGLKKTISYFKEVFSG